MSVSDGLSSVLALQGGRVGPVVLKELAASITAAGTVTMTNQYRNILKIDPGGAGRTVLLPPEEDGLCYWIVNAADAAENLTVKEDSNTTTVVTINQNESAVVVCMGSTWILIGVLSTAIS